jgi:hypothetical protein
MVTRLREALAEGRTQEGESAEISGFRQAEAIMNICRETEAVDF